MRIGLGAAALVASTTLVAPPPIRMAADTTDVAPIKTCPPPVPLARARQLYSVFDGILVDRWNEPVIVDGRLRTLRHYRFRVVRSWDADAGSDERWLVHGRSESQASMHGTYPVFEPDRRYLVVAIIQRKPPHAFTSSCLPGADGDDIERLAAELGPPDMTWDEPAPVPSPPLSHILARSAEDWVRLILVLARHLFGWAPGVEALGGGSS